MFKPKFFNRFCSLSVWSILILFFLGGLVRTTGSGMGCPDWPKCFGYWVPPTSAEELPEGYEKDYLEKRKQKVDRLANKLDNMGMALKAKALRQASTNMEAHAFNVRKTYTEYVNRLWGALTGIFTLLAAVSSLQFWKSDKAISLWAGLGLLFVLFNAWLGSVVVDTDLLGGVVTLHFVLAFIAITCYLLALTWKRKAESQTTPLLSVVIFTGLFVSIIQLLTGTGVRELVDQLTLQNVSVNLENFELLGTTFNFHRVLALLSGILAVVAYVVNRNKTQRPRISAIMLILIIGLVIQALSGIANIRFGFPVSAQLIHVTLGSISFVGFVYLSIFEVKSIRNYVN